jgi:Outer membrane lipoprotein involved in outer membrane biogenesis
MFFRHLRHLIAFGLIALLAGCAGFGARESVEGHGSPALWSEHKQQLTQLDGWQINGKVGIRAPKDSAAPPCSGCSVRIITTSASRGRWAGALPA